MQSDRRQVQTAVLSSPDSEDPVVLPLEAIELDAFRQSHRGATFWCGTLLGGCGGELATKLYRDRVCHFAHVPAADGQPTHCGRHARGVASADHLYVKAAAARWLRRLGRHDVQVDFAQDDLAPLGSVVNVNWGEGALRVHLDTAVEPDWTTGAEPILGASVPVDRDTLIRRWYVHRIAFDNDASSRRVRIGTEAFARTTEWFSLDECTLTPTGLSTPAVEAIVQAHRTPPPRWQPTAKPRRGPDPTARARALLRKLAQAQAVGSVVVVQELCEEIAAHDAADPADPALRAELTDSLQSSRIWLDQQQQVRRDMFERLHRATTDGDAVAARDLLLRMNATASHDRTEQEEQIAATATAFLDSANGAFGEEAVAARLRRPQGWRGPEAAEKARKILRRLDRRGDDMTAEVLQKEAAALSREAAAAGAHLLPEERTQAAGWERRAWERHRPPRSLQDQVGRRFRLSVACPRCLAPISQPCREDPNGPDSEAAVTAPHDERLQVVIDQRKERDRLLRLARSGTGLSKKCPDCTVEPGDACTTGESHPARVALEQVSTRD